MSHPLDKRKEDVLPLFHRYKDRHVGLRGLWTGKTPIPTDVKVLHEPTPAVKIPQMSLSGCLRFLSATVPRARVSTRAITASTIPTSIANWNPSRNAAGSRSDIEPPLPPPPDPRLKSPENRAIPRALLKYMMNDSID